MIVSEEKIQLEDSLYNLGWSSKQGRFFNLEFKQQSTDASEQMIVSYEMEMNLDITIHQRQVYTYFDWLGDVGGFEGIFSQLAGILISFAGFFHPDYLAYYISESNMFRRKKPSKTRSGRSSHNMQSQDLGSLSLLDSFRRVRFSIA